MIKLEDFTARLQKKIKTFRESFASAFDRVGRDSCTASQSDIESTKVIELIFTY